LVVEGAGGVLVPVNDEVLYADLFARWQVPVVVVSQLYLGSINHTLLTLEALRARQVPIAGLVLNGEPQPEVEGAIRRFGQVPVIGHIPVLPTVDAATLQQVFATFVWP
jgi:dethiobiotin synthetase